MLLTSQFISQIQVSKWWAQVAVDRKKNQCNPQTHFVNIEITETLLPSGQTNISSLWRLTVKYFKTERQWGNLCQLWQAPNFTTSYICFNFQVLFIFISTCFLYMMITFLHGSWYLCITWFISFCISFLPYSPPLSVGLFSFAIHLSPYFLLSVFYFLLYLYF